MQTGSKVRLATPADEAEIIALTRMIHAEAGRGRYSVDRVREQFALAYERKGGTLSVIGEPGHIRAVQLLMINREWYTDDEHLEDLINWVHPDHRRSDYGRLLIEHAKKCALMLSQAAGYKIPLFMGVVTNKRLSAKVALYRRFFGMPHGAIFVWNAAWMNPDDVSEENIWRMPSIMSLFLKRQARAESKEKARASA